MQTPANRPAAAEELVPRRPPGRPRVCRTCPWHQPRGWSTPPRRRRCRRRRGMESRVSAGARASLRGWGPPASSVSTWGSGREVHEQKWGWVGFRCPPRGCSAPMLRGAAGVECRGGSSPPPPRRRLRSKSLPGGAGPAGWVDFLVVKKKNQNHRK